MLKTQSMVLRLYCSWGLKKAAKCVLYNFVVPMSREDDSDIKDHDLFSSSSWRACGLYCSHISSTMAGYMCLTSAIELLEFTLNKSSSRYTILKQIAKMQNKLILQ